MYNSPVHTSHKIPWPLAGLAVIAMALGSFTLGAIVVDSILGIHTSYLSSRTQLASVSGAVTVAAASCSPLDVKTALDQAADGGVVQIPAGTCSWTETVTFSQAKSITIQGAGIDQTIIIDNIPRAERGGVLFVAETTAGKKFRITGLTIRGGPGGVDPNAYYHGTIKVAGNSREFRLDHIKFDKPNNPAVRFNGNVRGVIDHNIFDLRYVIGVLVYHDSWNDIPGYGDSSFVDSVHLGTEKAVFIEDNTFTGSGFAGSGVMDVSGGARVVFRYNNVSQDNLPTHGTETGGRYRGVRSYEIYNNTFTTNTLIWTAIFLRGGTGVIYNNTVGGVGGETGYTNFAILTNYRTVDDRNYTFGFCSGSNPWDGNQDASGYPCLDQIGIGGGDLISGFVPLNSVTGTISWPRQVSEPLYIWNNNWSPVKWNPGQMVANQAPSVIKEGRDYFLTPKPGYTPYTYPHPLVNDTPLPPPPPPAPPIPPSNPCNFDTPISSDLPCNPPTDTTPPVISTISAKSITSTGAVISWITNEASDTQVEYGLTTSYGNVTPLESSLTTTHTANLTSLVANTLYHYRVKSKDAAGNQSVSSDMTFTTMSDPVDPTVPTTPTTPTTPNTPTTPSTPTQPTTPKTPIDTTSSRAFVPTVTQKPVVTPTTTSIKFTRDFGIGAIGEDVRTLQKFLNSKGYIITSSGGGSPGNETTLFGSLTRSALIRYQLANGIPGTGYLGPLTRARITGTSVTTSPSSSTKTTSTQSTTPSSSLYIKPATSFTKLLDMGSVGPEVVLLQQILSNIPGIYPERKVTGVFDTATANAVGRFQEKYSIVTSNDTGYKSVGPKTRAKLNELWKK